VMLSDEAVLPYDRPPLSNGYLYGKTNQEKIRLLTPERIAELEIELHLSQPAQGLDQLNRQVHLPGATIAYDILVVATGA
jgi:NADPH-dependent 2,4-dienoyl-CoA reductase/sulfur reductase-like enzyme